MKKKGKGISKPKDIMTHKQKMFCEYYIQEHNATQAAIRAGYSKKTAMQIGEQNLTKLYVKEYVDKRVNEELEKTKADTTEILQFLTKVMRGEENDSYVQFNPDGTKTTVARQPLAQKIKAAELLGKTHKLFVETHEVKTNGGNITINVVPASEVKNHGKQADKM